LIAILAVVAVGLLSTKMLAHGRPESFEAAQSFGPEMLAILEKNRAAQGRLDPSERFGGHGKIGWIPGAQA
jgi:hypothetical protein